ncbi:MAG: hypothetical protein JOZ90_01395 [Alphaproteobacteria bacterium]|nr:hypothetical protein [Alphaproteobacteria bacterium]MBV9370245.1 hypothetical protein [Alphaproteobacteria bacterium]MBV9899730.1 hypothetical protein [Alphaproteobacteria bacterium]
MNWGILVPIAAIVIGPLTWVLHTWIRAKHGYPLQDKKGNLIGREEPRLRQENDALRETVQRLEARLQVLERIATDPAERTAREIESLRETPHAVGDR